MSTIRLRRLGPPCSIPHVEGVVVEGQVVEVPVGRGFEADPGWERVEEPKARTKIEKPAAAGREDGER